MDHIEVVGRPEMREQVAARLGTILVILAQRYVLRVEIDGVAIHEELNQRHGEDDHQAPRIPTDLNDLLPHHRENAAPAHTGTPGAGSRGAVSATNTSS